MNILYTLNQINAIFQLIVAILFTTITWYTTMHKLIKTNRSVSILHIFKPRQTFLIIVSLLACNAFSSNPLQLFTPGAYIIDMGQDAQTVENGVKPYGLVYQLIIVEGIPITWSINSSKSKDGVDFSCNGKQYKGGPFIIAAERLTPACLKQIARWKEMGVVVDGPIPGSFSAPVYKELTSWPRAVIDAQNDKLVIPFYSNAEVPVASYVSAGNPTMLTNCGDVYVLPHADPQDWTAASGYADSLKSFINQDGYLYYSCHAVSALESIKGCNFLSNDGLVLWDDHDKGTPPYTYAPSNAGDPVMQFLGTLDASTLNGSEQIYLPNAAGWRQSTTIAVYDPDNSDIPGTSPGPAAIVAYGRAFGTAGMVMVNAGHALDQGTLSSRVAAQRAYFNFLLMAGVQKQILISNPVFPAKVSAGATYTVSAAASGGIGPYTYKWSSSCGVTFSNPTSPATSFTAPGSFTTCTIKFEVQDACGRINFASRAYTRDSSNQIVTDAGGPVITRAQYRSSISTSAPDTIRITVNKLINCTTLGSENKLSTIFELYDESGNNTTVLNDAIIIGGCPATYTSTVTMIVKNRALETPSNDSIAFVEGTDAVVDQIGNKPSVNNKAVKLEWGMKREVVIGISNNPFIPDVTQIPSVVKQNYAEVTSGITSGTVITINSTTPLKSISGVDYGKVTIYDAVANIVMADLPIIKVTSERYGIYWDGRNRNKRRVGSGVYLAVISFTDMLGNKSIEKIKIGVH